MAEKIKLMPYKKPQVSVVIPVFNIEKYISKCLDSVINQTLKDIEILCINDSTEDDSCRILNDYAKRDDRIKIYSHEHNRGLSAARNTGLQHAEGRFIYFMDGDDYLDLDTLKICFHLAVTNNLDVVTFDAEVFVDDPVLRSHSAALPDFNRSALINSKTVYSGKDYFIHIYKNNAYRPPVVLHFLKLEFIKSAKLSFYEGILYEDELFTIQLYSLAQRISYCPMKFFKRRIRANSIMTNTISYRNIHDLLLIADKLYTLCKNESGEFRKVLLSKIYSLVKIIDKMMSDITDHQEQQKSRFALAKNYLWKKYSWQQRRKNLQNKILIFRILRKISKKMKFTPNSN